MIRPGINWFIITVKITLINYKMYRCPIYFKKSILSDIKR
jgi:hypothetical protein